MSCKVYKTASGFVTHFALADDPDDANATLTCAWGQSAANGGQLTFSPRSFWLMRLTLERRARDG